MISLRTLGLLFSFAPLAACGAVEHGPASSDAGLPPSSSSTSSSSGSSAAPPKPIADAGEPTPAVVCPPSRPSSGTPCTGNLHCAYACGESAHCKAGQWAVDIHDMICPFACGDEACSATEFCLERATKACASGEDVTRQCPNASCYGRTCTCP